MTKSRGSLPRLDFIFIAALTLLAFALRLVALVEVPPGWRDDELINIHALSGELFKGHFPLYFTGASGHEPLYHYLQAGFNALAGYNVLSGHLLSVFLGTLTVPLTFVLVRRLFGSLTAALTALGLTCSFWSLMYSRIGLRHINLSPVVLAAFFLLWLPLISRRQYTLRQAFLLGITLSLSLYIYPAAALLPVLLVIFGLYLALFHHERFRDVWIGFVLVLVVAAILAIPLVVAIRQGSTEAAAQGIGAGARVVELAKPIRALQQGDPGPLLDNTWTTLGMFHATGDPEWLYNIANRPVFNLLGGALLWAGVFLCLYHWRRPRYFFLLLWLGFGLLPTVFSVPPASLSHSILVQALAYLLPILVLVHVRRWITFGVSSSMHSLRAFVIARYALSIIMALFLLTNIFRDLYDYFIVWPQEDMVRFLYRADYRQAAQYLDDHPQIMDVAVGSTLMGPWDRLALENDMKRDDVRVRLFNPQQSLLLPADLSPAGYPKEEPVILVTVFPPLDRALAELLGSPGTWGRAELLRYRSPGALPSLSVRPSLPAFFENGLELVGVAWPEGEPGPGQEANLWLTWRVARPLDLPPIPIIANPPPAGVYNGPRLAVFTHLLDTEGRFIVGDDWLWVDPVTLLPGDRFLQVHRLPLLLDAPPGPYTLEIGLYDPLTNERWSVLDAQGQPAAEYVLLPTQESKP